ncbi:MAG: FKBP-type peptidyl-prolyl cis-trans isomerase [Planctomycetota bacterium]|nr:FKBP-type peptidyl-prolyl cis-trans isomerase [Planctomycetota bacterium]
MKSLLQPLLLAAIVPATALCQIPECEDMKTTDSGLQYGVLKLGAKMPGPAAEDMVKVHYTGWLTDGTEFDSSHKRGQPAKFQVDQVIKGWTEGLQLMTPGARFKLVIPPELGYGAQETGSIPPNSTLVFDVELLEVIKLPTFPDGNEENQVELANGGKYELLKKGDGAPVAQGTTEALAFRYAIFSPDGRLLDCSALRNGNQIGGTRETLPFQFLNDRVDVVGLGDTVRVEVSQTAVPNFRSDTVWLLDVVGVHRLPEFRTLDSEKVITTDSGLKYEVIEVGEGESPKAEDTVEALYTGWLDDGTMFDSAHARGMPSSFPLNRVIAGWTEGLQLMKPGGKVLFEIPAELGYGVRGSPPKIPANAKLYFLVELVSVDPKKPQ